jgi:glycine cleavage system aminomethyltransferase T
VPVEYAAPGTRLEIEVPEGMRRATVVPMPFIDPDKAIAKS